MAYQHDLFVSYRRSPTVGLWVKNHLVPRLEARLNDISPHLVKVFCDFKMTEGVNWPVELKQQIKHSGLLIAVWSADYFRSDWCMAEWQSFREREAALGLFTESAPQGLVYPVRYADGDYFHADARITQCRRDFSSLNYPDDVFKLTAKYLEFDDLVREMAKDLVVRIAALPDWATDFPIVEPRPMSPPQFERPVI